MEFDLLIVGAGPVGLCLAQALKTGGLRIGLIDQQPREALSTPAFDGREIALTHHSVALLRRLGLWPRLGEHNTAPLRDALVMDGAPGPLQPRLHISHRLSDRDALGYLVGNHHIRRAAYRALMDSDHPDAPPPTLFDGTAVTGIQTTAEGARLALDNGRALHARLVVAADSRHSATRRAMGIAADLHDHGRAMLVCQMTHDAPHHQTAWEWFDHGQTLAVLPMNPCPETGQHRSSIVLTLPARQLQPLLAATEEAFNTALETRFAGQLGRMALASSRHIYPLVGVWARQLVAQRFALVGDAAVGMHPVTAHGFNLGLRSVETLSALLLRAQRQGSDIAAPGLLLRYQREHQRASRGLYWATHTLATLYTQDDAPARWLRQALLGAAERLTPFKRALAASLTGAH